MPDPGLVISLRNHFGPDVSPALIEELLLVDTVVFVELVSVLTSDGAAVAVTTLFPEEEPELPDTVTTFPEVDVGLVVTVPEEGAADVVPELVFVVTVVVVVVTVVLPLLLVLVELDELLVEPGEAMVSEDEFCVVPPVAWVTVIPSMLLVHTPSLLKLY